MRLGYIDYALAVLVGTLGSGERDELALFAMARTSWDRARQPTVGGMAVDPSRARYVGWVPGQFAGKAWKSSIMARPRRARIIEPANVDQAAR